MIVTVAVVTVAPFVGAVGSTINPFMTGIGSSKAGVSIADGWAYAFAAFGSDHVGHDVSIRFCTRGRVKADPSKSLCGFSE